MGCPFRAMWPDTLRKSSPGRGIGLARPGLNRGRIKCMRFADDMALVAEDERMMNMLMGLNDT